MHDRKCCSFQSEQDQNRENEDSGTLVSLVPWQETIEGNSNGTALQGKSSRKAKEKTVLLSFTFKKNRNLEKYVSGDILRPRDRFYDILFA